MKIVSDSASNPSNEEKQKKESMNQDGDEQNSRFNVGKSDEELKAIKMRLGIQVPLITTKLPMESSSSLEQQKVAKLIQRLRPIIRIAAERVKDRIKHKNESARANQTSLDSSTEDESSENSESDNSDSLWTIFVEERPRTINFDSAIAIRNFKGDDSPIEVASAIEYYEGLNTQFNKSLRMKTQALELKEKERTTSYARKKRNEQGMSCVRNENNQISIIANQSVFAQQLLKNKHTKQQATSAPILP